MVFSCLWCYHKKRKSSSLPRNLAHRTFGELPIVLSTKVNLIYLLYLMAQRFRFLHLMKQNHFLKTFLGTLILMTQVSLDLFSLLEIIWNCLIFVTLKMVKKVITNLNLSKASRSDCIPVVVLKNCEPELSYILSELFNNCLKKSCFSNSWEVSLVVCAFKNVGERSTAKNCRPVSLLSVVTKFFEKGVNNMIIDHLDKCGLFSDFQYSFRSSRSTADLLTVVSDRIAVAFDRVWYAGLCHKPKCYGILCQVFGLISSFLSRKWFRWFWMESLHKNIQLMSGINCSPRLHLWSYTFPTIH